ncbi:MAG: hypothetical protein ACR2HF_07590, partial [Methylococcaceae bacterium]
RLDVVVESAGRTSGNDTVQVTDLDYTLPDNVENLELLGQLDLKGTGNKDKNRITGNDGNNLLDGGNGFDTLMGGD